MAVTFVANQRVYHPSRDRRGREIGHLSRPRGMRNDTRGAITRRDLSSTLERGAERVKKERKKEERKEVSAYRGTQARNKYRIKAGVREWLRGGGKSNAGVRTERRWKIGPTRKLVD